MDHLRFLITALLWGNAVWAFQLFTPSLRRYRSSWSSSSPVILHGWFDRPSWKRSTLPKVGLDLKFEQPKGYRFKLELTVDFPTTGGAVQSREGPAWRRNQFRRSTSEKSSRKQGPPKSGLEFFKLPSQNQRKAALQGASARREYQFRRSREKSKREQGRSPVRPKVDLNSIVLPSAALDRSSTRKSSRISRSINRKRSRGMAFSDQRSSWGVPKLDLPELDLPMKPIELPTVELPKLELDLKPVELPKVELPMLDLFDFGRAGPTASARRKKPVPPKKPPPVRKKPVPPKEPPPVRLRERKRKVRQPVKRSQMRTKTSMGSGKYRTSPPQVKRRRKVEQPKYDGIDLRSLEQDLAKFVEDPSSPFWLD